MAGLLETPTWIPRVRVTEFLNTSFVAREPEPVRLDPLQADVERLYGEKVVGDLEPDLVAGTTAALRDLGLERARVGFDDLRAGSTYTWQRFKAELELPIDYSRYGGLFLGGQFLRYENNFGSGVDNRGISLDYRFRFQ